MRFKAKSEIVRAARACLVCVAAWTPTFAAEIGSVCLRDFTPGLTCSGNDVSIAQLIPITVTEDCPSGDPGSAVAVFKMRVAAGSMSRYDIGLFLALNGDSAESGGNCFHDYLEPPLATSPTYGDSDANGRPDINGGPWWDAEPFDSQDHCGDIAGNTDVLKTLISFRFACADSNLNGFVDFSTCTTWSSGTVSSCGGLSDAHGGTAPRCACNVVDTSIAMPTGGGRVGGLTVARSGSSLALAWGASCSANDTDYAVYEGALGSFSGHHSVVCSTGGATSATIQPAAGNGYYLVVPRNAQREGSYGVNGDGAERPPATSACLPQIVGSPCS